MSILLNIDPLIAFKEGREEGFTYFFNSCYKPLYFFATRYVKDSAAAEDIITDSFIKLWDKREIFETEQGIKLISINQCTMHQFAGCKTSNEKLFI
jgi:RNA polymerase sigma-70 factor (ECF subfamily)